MPQEQECSVLLIEDQPEAAKLVQYVLSKGSSPKLVVDWAQDLHTGLERLAEDRFQAVLLDLNLPDSNGFETFARVRQQAADPAVIVLTAQEDEGLALQAVRSGADEYLIKSDIRDRFLAQRIRHAIERRRLSRQNAAKAIRKGRIFGFLGSKGGCGTTTLVLNLAAALAKAGKSVAAVELVPGYGSFAAHFRHSPSWNTATLLKTAADAITRDEVESCLADVECGFRVMFGPQRPEDYREVSPEHARALLRNVATLVDYSLVDLPSSLAPYTAEVIEHAAFVTLVVEQDWLGLDSGSLKLPLLESAGARHGEIGLAIVNKTPHVETLPVLEFSRRLGYGVVAAIPAAGDLLAANRGAAPVAMSRPETAFAACLDEMAGRFCADPIRFVKL